MGGDIYLDKTYVSGMEGLPGTKFVVNLNASPCKEPPLTDLIALESISNNNTAESTETDPFFPPVNTVSFTDLSMSSEQPEILQLPEECSVLFTDDDAILRKLLVRAVKRVAPGWRCYEAASGEAALKLAEEECFDLIFMDQYMASVEKQLLGSETVAIMRQRGLQCTICGLSANDKEEEFREAGANCFSMKPFPCEKEKLKHELLRILMSKKFPALS